MLWWSVCVGGRAAVHQVPRQVLRHLSCDHRCCRAPVSGGRRSRQRQDGDPPPLAPPAALAAAAAHGALPAPAPESGAPLWMGTSPVKGVCQPLEVKGSERTTASTPAGGTGPSWRAGGRKRGERRAYQGRPASLGSGRQPPGRQPAAPPSLSARAPPTHRAPPRAPRPACRLAAAAGRPWGCPPGGSVGRGSGSGLVRAGAHPGRGWTSA